MILHPIPPIYDKSSRVLILGSFPSVKSREAGFFYAHPQNRFFRVLSALFGEELPKTNDQRRELLLRHQIAVWDVIKSCDIIGSSDSSITNAEANDISTILDACRIQRIFTNGKTAYTLYNKHISPQVGIAATPLPSTSPANAAWNMDRLIEEWKAILE